MLYYGEHRIVLADLSTMITQMIQRGEELARTLDYESDLGFLEQRDPALLHNDLSWAANGDSFVTSEKNAFIANGAERVRNKALAGGFCAQMVSLDHRRRPKLGHGVVSQYSLQVKELRRIIMVLKQVTGGMPGRGSELMTIKKENTWSSMRNVFAVHNEWIIFLTEYSKTQNRSNASRVIPRFLSAKVGRLLVKLLVDILPFEGYLRDTAEVVRGGTPYLFANPDYTAPREAEYLSDALNHFTKQFLDVPIRLQDYRHIAIAIEGDVVRAFPDECNDPATTALDYTSDRHPPYPKYKRLGRHRHSFLRRKLRAGFWR